MRRGIEQGPTSCGWREKREIKAARKERAKEVGAPGWTPDVSRALMINSMGKPKEYSSIQLPK